MSYSSGDRYTEVGSLRLAETLANLLDAYCLDFKTLNWLTFLKM